MTKNRGAKRLPRRRVCRPRHSRNFASACTRPRARNSSRRAPTAPFRFIRVAPRSSVGRCSARWTSREALRRTRTDAQSSCATCACIATLSAPICMRASGSASGASGTDWPARCRSHHPCTWARRRSTSGKAITTWPCWIAIRRASSSLPMTATAGRPALLDASVSSIHRRRATSRSPVLRSAIAQLPLIQARSDQAYPARSPPDSAAALAWLAACS